MVAQADREVGGRQLQLSIRDEVLPEARVVCETLIDELGADRLEVIDGLARLALVGSGMHGRPGVYARTFQALLRVGVAVDGLSTSSSSVTRPSDAEAEERAVRG